MRWLLPFVLCLLPAMAAAQCRQALVLALDVSGSVNDTEYYQQINGLADALSSPQVSSILLNGMAPVSIAVFEWSSQNHQHLLQNWISINSAQALEQLVLRIRSHRKRRAGLKTAIGTAMQFTGQLLAHEPNCWRQTVDVSADGKNNAGPPPANIVRSAAFDGVTVNALIIAEPRAQGQITPGGGPSPAELENYFSDQILLGPTAFVMRAEGYADYARAMEIKLIRELSLPVFSAAPIGAGKSDIAPNSLN